MAHTAKISAFLFALATAQTAVPLMAQSVAMPPPPPGPFQVMRAPVQPNIQRPRWAAPVMPVPYWMQAQPQGATTPGAVQAVPIARATPDTNGAGYAPQNQVAPQFRFVPGYGWTPFVASGRGQFSQSGQFRAGQFQAGQFRAPQTTPGANPYFQPAPWATQPMSPYFAPPRGYANGPFNQGWNFRPGSGAPVQPQR